MKRILPVLLLLFFICACSSNGGSSGGMVLVAESEGGRLYKAGPVSVLQLNGTHYQMGRQYGRLLKDDLTRLYDSVIATFSPRYPYPRMKQIADAIYAVYPQKYKDILTGMAETSGLGMEKQIVLNALEFFPKIDRDVPRNCSGIAVADHGHVDPPGRGDQSRDDISDHRHSPGPDHVAEGPRDVRLAANRAFRPVRPVKIRLPSQA